MKRTNEVLNYLKFKADLNRSSINYIIVRLYTNEKLPNHYSRRESEAKELLNARENMIPEDDTGLFAG
jgi:predicted transcriptional regulator